MAFTTPFTAVAGTAWKSADWNTYARDNIAWIATDSPVCRAYSSVAFSHTSSGSALAVTLDSERFDNAAIHSTSTNTSRLTIPTGAGGKYLFGGTVEFAPNATGLRAVSGRVNGATYVTSQSFPAAASATTGSICSVYSFAAADYIEMMAFQSSGGTLAVSATSAYSPEFWIQWIRN